MTFIFYFLFAFTAFIIELGSISNPGERQRKGTLIREYSSRKKAGEDPKLPNDIIWQMFYVLLAFIGIFSSQWLLFLLLFVVSFIFSKLRKYKIFIVIDSIITLIIVMMIIINKFHLHYDLTSLLKMNFNL